MYSFLLFNKHAYMKHSYKVIVHVNSVSNMTYFDKEPHHK